MKACICYIYGWLATSYNEIPCGWDYSGYFLKKTHLGNSKMISYINSSRNLTLCVCDVFIQAENTFSLTFFSGCGST